MSLTGRATILLLPPLALLLAAIVQDRAGPVNHGDEPAWVANAYYGQLALAGDLRNPDWRLLPAKDSPPVGKYVFALALRAIGRPVRTVGPLAGWYAQYERIPGAWGTGEAYERRQEIANRVDWAAPRIGLDQVRACRRVALVAGMLAAIGVASIGLAMRGPVTGLLAGLAFALHPVTIPASMLAMFDTMALMWSVASVRLLMGLIQASGWKRALLALALGLSMAMAVGTKMNALIVVFLTGLVALPLIGRKSSRVTGAALAGSLLIGLAVFVAINPALYPNVRSGLADLFRLPAETTRVQAGFLPDFLGSWSSKIETVGRLLVGFREGLWLVVAFGLIATIGAVRDRCRLVAVAWCWLAMALVVGWVPFPWPRYVLPMVPCACLMAADSWIGLVELIRRPRLAPSQPQGGSATMSGRC